MPKSFPHLARSGPGLAVARHPGHTVPPIEEPPAPGVPPDLPPIEEPPPPPGEPPVAGR
ncbi:hypothetical protein K6V92_05995 [Cupriavidus respiraculi]|uniref:hypothetical protein n=1 Tax=Cupriavidus respiraculi TaxID=195930 RepID=UPI001C965B1E|nr:hypothetical protein [Cupriavidus respiraculi]MBY4946172.1 hypothetical protein [Cupriavidus respiraculi]